jgi:hypothetical protein
MSFKIQGLPTDTFRSYFALDDRSLHELGLKKCVADESPGFPCRVSLQDAEPGETLILGSFEHHTTNGPFRSSGPVFIRQEATQQCTAINTVPKLLSIRQLSVRAYDQDGLMRDALVTAGEQLSESIEGLFEDPLIDYLQVHNAQRGCFFCQVDRV